jgi:hypothetical protein
MPELPPPLDESDHGSFIPTVETTSFQPSQHIRPAVFLGEGFVDPIPDAKDANTGLLDAVLLSIFCTSGLSRRVEGQEGKVAWNVGAFIRRH